MQPDPLGWWNLPEGHYEVVMENVIEVGDGEAGWVITRSTLNRNGVFLTSGLYDTGYHGVMAGMMHVTCGAFRVQRGTRIGQYLSFDAENLSEYKGSYGIGTAHDQKYGGTDEPKKQLNWYQKKKINVARREQAAKDKLAAEGRETMAREELAARQEEQRAAKATDAVQATITTVVTKGGK